MPSRVDVYGYVTCTGTCRYGWGVVEYVVGQGELGTFFQGDGERYNPPHDQRHRVNLVAEYDVGFLTANLAWQFSTGRPFTQMIGYDAIVDPRNLRNRPGRDYGIQRALFDEPYNARLPTYLRLDVSVKRTFELGQSALTLNDGAINVYGRRNVFYVDVFRVRRIVQLPIVPYVGVELEFNGRSGDQRQ